MDPGTMLLAATVAQVAGQGMEAFTGYKQGKSDARTAGANAMSSRADAALTRLKTSQAEEAKRREVRKSIGSSAAAIAQAGIGSPGQGSAGAALNQAANEGELDALNIRYGGETQAVAYENEALNYDAEQRASKRRAKGAVVSGLVSMGTTALSGAASYGNYKAGQKVLDATARDRFNAMGGSRKLASNNRRGFMAPSKATKTFTKRGY